MGCDSPDPIFPIEIIGKEFGSNQSVRKVDYAGIDPEWLCFLAGRSRPGF
jgi:hypothetical protein